MALKSKVKSLDLVPEADRAHYRKVEDPKSPINGEYVIDHEEVDGYAIRNIDLLNKALGTERRDREALEKQLKDFADLDPSKARDALKKVEDMKNWKPDDKVQDLIKTHVAEAKSGLEGDLKKASDRNAELDKRLRKLLVTSHATTAIAKLEGDVDLLMPIVEKRARIVEKDGDFVVTFEGDDGIPMISKKSGETGNMGFEEFVTGLRDRHPAAFKGHGGAGSGANGGQHRSGGRERWQISEADSRDLSKWENASKAAKEAGRTLPEIVK